MRDVKEEPKTSAVCQNKRETNANSSNKIKDFIWTLFTHASLSFKVMAIFLVNNNEKNISGLDESLLREGKWVLRLRLK